MADMARAQHIGKDQGKGKDDATGLALFLKVYGGEVLTAFARQAQTLDKVMVRTIQNGKSAQFPVMGRTKAYYLKAGKNLDDLRGEIKHTEKVISIDGLLTTDVLIYDIEDAMNHYDVRSEYSRQMGEALAMATDAANYGEIAKLVNSRSAAATNENIEGLGSSSLIMVGKDIVDAADPAKIGEALIQALTYARAEFTKRYIPAGDRYFATSPDNYSAILSAMMPHAANYAALIDPETGNIRNVMGFEVYETPHMVKMADFVTNPADVLGGGDGHIFPTTAASDNFAAPTGTAVVNTTNVMGLYWHRSAVATLKLKDMALERARRPEFQADQLIAKYAMGHGGLRPEAAGAIIVTKDAATGVKVDKLAGHDGAAAAALSADEGTARTRRAAKSE